MLTGQTLFEEGVSQVTATPSVKLGMRTVDTSGNHYVYAYNAGLYEGFPGNPAVLGSSNTGYSFTVSCAASQVGCFVGGIHHTTIPTAYYGWIMTRGLCRVRPDTSAVSANAGDWLALGVDGGYVSAPASIATSPRNGLAVNSITTNYGTTPASCGLAWIRSDIW